MIGRLAILALPLAVLAACSNAPKDPAVIARDNQIEVCANQVAKDNALTRKDLSAFFDRTGVTPGSGVVSVTGPAGSFTCEIDANMTINRLIQTKGPGGNA